MLLWHRGKKYFKTLSHTCMKLEFLHVKSYIFFHFLLCSCGGTAIMGILKTKHLLCRTYRIILRTFLAKEFANANERFVHYADCCFVTGEYSHIQNIFPSAAQHEPVGLFA